MKSRWIVTLFAVASVVAAWVGLQGCAGTGGPTSSGTGSGDTASKDFLALLSNEQKTASYIGSDACGKCHDSSSSSSAISRETGETIYTHWKQTVHATKGVGCERCHGPGSAHQANPTSTNILSVAKSTNPVVCAQCHGPLVDQYNYSGHKNIIASPVQGATTSPASYGKTNRCLSCHSGLYRALYVDHPADIANLPDQTIINVATATMTDSPHTATCATCHNPHATTGNLTQNGKEVQLRMPVFNTDTTNIAAGTTAAQFTSFQQTCAQCHNGRGTNPADSALNASTSRPSMHDSNQMNMLMGIGGAEGTRPPEKNTAHAQAPGQCTKCHMPDARHTFTVSYDTGCSPCHTAADAAARASSIKTEILNSLVALRARMDAWALANKGNSLFWEYTSNITAEGLTAPAQSGIPIQIKRSRHNYYFVIRSGDYGVHNAPYAKYLLEMANGWLDDIGVARTATRSTMTTQQKLNLIKGDLARARRAELEAQD